MSTERDAIEKQVAEELGLRLMFFGEDVPPEVAEGQTQMLWDALVAARLKLAGVERERDKAVKGQESTWKWLESKYGKLDEWSRTILPEPWRTQFWNCRANGLYDQTKDVGEPYRCNAGMMITPSNYFHLKEPQILYDQIARAESASLKLAAADRLAPAMDTLTLVATLFDNGTPDDEIISIGHWSNNELPRFFADIAIPLGDIRKWRSALLEYQNTKV